MKPQSLQRPYIFSNRRVLLEDRILYVPEYYFEYTEFILPSFIEIFGNTHPVHIEYCSGNGAWIIDKAMQNPQVNWIAVEKRFDRVQKIWSKMKNANLQNLFIICGEAQTATQYYLPAGSIRCAYINFPDPWPKGRHAKHRLIQSDFIELLSHVLQSEASITLVTDDMPYLNQIIELFQNANGFSAVFSEPYYVTITNVQYGNSYFYDLWSKLGRTIYMTNFQKNT